MMRLIKQHNRNGILSHFAADSQNTFPLIDRGCSRSCLSYVFRFCTYDGDKLTEQTETAGLILLSLILTLSVLAIVY